MIHTLYAWAVIVLTALAVVATVAMTVAFSGNQDGLALALLALVVGSVLGVPVVSAVADYLDRGH